VYLSDREASEIEGYCKQHPKDEGDDEKH